MLDALTLDQMRIFVTVAESGSFRAGAARLSRVQSAISHAVANLEAELRIKLFDRSGHRPELTAEGRALLSDAKAILLRVDAMRARARGLGEGLELSLSIAVDPLLPMELLALALSRLHAEFPTVAVRLVAAPMGAAVQAVLDRQSALAVTTASQYDPYVEAELLASLPAFIPVCAATHPLAHNPDGKPWTGAQLAEHLQIVVTDPSTATKGQDFGVLSLGTWRVSDIAMKHALILTGCGWGNLPAWMTARDIEAGALTRVKAAALEAKPMPMPVYLLRRLDAPLGPAGRFLREELETALAGQGSPASNR